MNRVRNLLSIFGGIAFVMIILDSKLTLEGAQTGMDLCIRTVIPTLFPFVVLSTLLSVSTVPCSQLIRTAAGFLGIPADASTVLIPAFLGGYPVGAKCVYTLYCTGRIEKSQAERLLTFCSNAGPSFLFGIVSGCFTKPETAWVLWLIHVVASILTAISIPEIKPICPDKAKNTAIREETDILLSSIKAMGVICGWVILFRVLITFLQKWCLWLLPQWLQVLPPKDSKQEHNTKRCFSLPTSSSSQHPLVISNNPVVKTCNERIIYPWLSCRKDYADRI